MLLLILLSLIVASCSTLTVPNEELCVEKTRENASCFWSIEGPKRQIPKEVWRIERIGRVSMKPEAFGNYRKTIEKACLKMNCIINGKDGLLVIERFADEFIKASN